MGHKNEHNYAATLLEMFRKLTEINVTYRLRFLKHYKVT